MQILKMTNIRMTLSLIVLCASMKFDGAYGQAFKGHTIGETTAAFLVTEPALKAKLTNCQDNAPRELTDDELRRQFGRKAAENFARQEAQLNAQGQHMRHLNRDPDVYGDQCGGLLSALVSGLGQIDGNGYDLINPYRMKLTHRAISEKDMTLMPRPVSNDRWFVFDKGLLVSLAMNLDVIYDTVRADVSSRLGVSPIETRIPFHNAFGAQWEAVTSTWNTVTLHAELTQDHNPGKPSLPRLGVSDKAWESTHASSRAAPASSLD